MPGPHPRFRSLLAPDACAVVLIACGESDVAAAGPLLQASEMHGVPAIAVMAEDAEPSPLSVPALVSRRLNPLDDDHVLRSLAALGRPRLLVGGRCAETVLAFTVLSALEEGFDVHLLRDLVCGSSESLTDTAVARMVQAGAVPVSVVQVIAEWRCSLTSAA